MARPTPTARALDVLDDLPARSRSTLAARVERLRILAPAIAQTGIAVTLAWLAAKHVAGHRQPFFAPVAAIVCLVQAYGERTRRAIEVTAGNVVGVLVAELVVLVVGRGALPLALIVCLALVATILLGGGRLAVTQSGVAAVLIATVSTGHSGFQLTRPIDALVGGVCALVVGLLLFPIDPVRLARSARGPLLDELGVVLAEIREGLMSGDHDLGVDALARARGLDARAASFADAAKVGTEIARGSPLRRGGLGVLARERAAAQALAVGVGNVQGLARGAVRATDLDANVADETVASLDDLAAAVAALGGALDDPDDSREAHAALLRAAGRATLGLERTANLSASVLVGQVRTIATDLLRALGVGDDEAVHQVRGAATRAAEAELAE